MSTVAVAPGVVEALHLEQVPPRRDQVLDLFGPTARKLAR